MKHILLGSAITASFLLSGCGSDTVDTALNTTGTTLDSSTGYVVDAAVANLNYDCVADGEMNKTTGADGAFSCTNMSQVRFRIGDLVLGEISALPQDGYVFPQDIAGVNRSDLTDANVTAMAQLLQSLDADNNLTNGIQIPENTEDVFENETFTAADLDTYLEQASVNPEHIRTKTEAENHLKDTMHTLPGVNNDPDAYQSTGGIPDISTWPRSILTPEAKETLSYMGNEERLAHDVYMNLYTYWNTNGTEIKQLLNIAQNAEIKHIEAVQSLVRKYNLTPDQLENVGTPVADMNTSVSQMPSGQYDIEEIQNLYNTLYAKGTQSVQDALEVGCMVEVTDITDLDADIGVARASNADDVVEIFNYLRNGSYNHYWSFDKGLKNMGVADGCCSLGADYCHPEYPQNENGGNGQEHGQEHGQGQGQGQGKH